MAQRVAAIFQNREAAERAADALVDLGADRGHVSMLARGQEGTHHAGRTGTDADGDFVEPAREVGDSGAALTTTDTGNVASGATMGAVAGLAAGLLALMVPGIGLVLAAGPLALAAGSGAIAGGIYGGLRDIGVEEQHARHYEERIRGGGVLLTALAPELPQARVLEVLAEHGAEDVSFADDRASAPVAAPRETVAAPAAAMRDTASEEIRVPVTEETVEVRKQQREVGEVAVRKDVEVETQRISEPVTQTRVVAERRPVSASDQYQVDPNATVLREGEEIRVPVVKEEIKVEKVPRVTEEVVIRTQPETEVIERDVQVRHERVEVEEEGEVDETTSAGATRSTPRSSPG
jgi:uncharacterized protein (TIGR02271 family)